MTETKTISFGSIAKVIGAILILIFLLVAFKNMILSKDEGNIDSKAIVDNGDAQIVNLGFKNRNYYPNTIEVEAGRPVKIVANLKEITGCYRGFVIPNLKINKYLRENDNIIEFTPIQKGVIPFSCVMGMGTGQIIVK
ncbi:MAG TPA: cupredoxin domain-containing protein [Candidatus Nanoarchaeia archaeon]|nr:cupredoxin domain-containing protein [Candidatus Nanoarchaeia archaeon]